MNLHLHLIDATGRHFVFDISARPVTILVKSTTYVFDGKDNDLQEKFVQLYQKLLVEKNSLCVTTDDNSIMLHADQITGIQMRRE